VSAAELWIRVRPRSARAGIALGDDGGIVVRVHAPPEGGRANRECAEIVAGALRVPKSSVRVVRGEKSRRKQLAVEGLESPEMLRRLEVAAGGRRGQS
jgi:uncharacterized protein (TIGR00251 family)